ncbi:MAG: exonuclease subunit SbcD, partial [Eubacteriales bacterium]|nr:exonuclease subunit SbcD [Eubacteriales bacterium]
MKFFHLSDLHLGKRVNAFPMIEDQKYILNQIIDLADQEAPDAVIIAGDVYDKSVPSVEAVNLFDDFLVSLVKRKLRVFIISGNHDSAERVSYGGRVMEQSGIHISPRITGTAFEESDGSDGSDDSTVSIGFISSEDSAVPNGSIASATSAASGSFIASNNSAASCSSDSEAILK